MSYYSDVAIALKASDWQEMQKQAENKPEVFDYPIAEFWEEIQERKDGIVVLRFRGKWYPCYPEIQFIKLFLKNIEHEFIRVGDDAGDIETITSFKDGSDFFCTQTNIVVRPA